MTINDFKGLNVTHISYGKGVIDDAWFDKNNGHYYMTVSFKQKTMKMGFPNAFEGKFIKLNDKKLQEEVEKLIKSDKFKL